MGKVAFVFAGPGSQYTGMGRDLYENSEVSRKVFEKLEHIRPGTKEQCFTASKEELSITVNTQPCIFAVQMAAVKSLEEQGVFPDAIAGFSLGEISALTYAGIFPLEECFLFILQRGDAMNKAAAAGNGQMAAILGLDAGTVETICESLSNVWAVNYNCPGQTVISGKDAQVEAAMEECRKRGGKAILLAVGGAFHSPLMEDAGRAIHEMLKGRMFGSLKYPVYSNVTGEILEESKILARIEEHVKSPVLWQKSIESMHRDGINLFVEIGPGKVLSGMIRKILPDAVVVNAEDMNSIAKAVFMVKNR
jgi:[acyl-carrier-protein] S-malonyltransferase